MGAKAAESTNIENRPASRDARTLAAIASRLSLLLTRNTLSSTAPIPSLAQAGVPTNEIFGGRYVQATEELLRLKIVELPQQQPGSTGKTLWWTKIPKGDPRGEGALSLRDWYSKTWDFNRV